MNTSIYIHIPFCTHRCAYCDFNTYAGQEDSIPAYVDALLHEVKFIGHQTTQLPNHPTIGTIFFGGGTPSLLSGPQIGSILDALRSAFTFSPDLEATLEANPGTTSLEKLKQYRAAGINRLSFGVQSANSEELHMLERAHDFFDVIQSVKWARQAGFDNLNLDLIYGLPEQTLATWQSSVQRIVDLGPEHISAYALTLEHGTPFGRWTAKGLLPVSDPDLAADMYEWLSEFLESAGYVQYEISNWAKLKDESGKMKDEENSSFSFHPSSFFACRHNLQYWRGLPYLGLGAGAHGYAGGVRYSNVLRIKTYIERLASVQSPVSGYQFPLTPAVVNQHRQTPQDEMGEFMMTGLRLTREGVSDKVFAERFGKNILGFYEKSVGQLMEQGLLEWTDDQLHLSRRGRLLGNQVFMHFVGE